MSAEPHLAGIRELQLLTRAYNIIPDSERRKTELATRIAQLMKRTAPAINKTTAAAKSDTNDNSKIQKSPQLTLDPSPLPVLRRAAELAEQSGRSDAYRFWLRLADEELVSMPKESISDFKHALSLYQRGEIDSVHYKPLISGQWGFVEKLVKNGMHCEAEELLRETAAKIAVEFGKVSPPAAVQLSELFVFLMTQNREQEAMKVLDEIIQIGPRNMEVGLYTNSATKTLQQYARSISKERSVASLAILNKILDAQIKTYGHDDERVAETLVIIGKAYESAGKNLQAVAKFSEAQQIRKLYLGDLRALKEQLPNFWTVWDKLGKAVEKKQAQKSIRALEKREWPPDYVDPVFHRERAGPIATESDKSHSYEARLAFLTAEYEAARAQAPYSPRSIDAVENLIAFASQAKDWELLAKSSIAREIIRQHMSDAGAGRSSGCVPPRYKRIDFCKLAAEAYIKLGRIDEAQRVIAEFTATMPALWYFEYIILAQLELDCKNTEKAAEYASLAQSEIRTETWLSNSLAHIWKRLNQPERAAEVMKQHEAQKLNGILMRKQSDNSALKFMRGY